MTIRKEVLSIIEERNRQESIIITMPFIVFKSILRKRARKNPNIQIIEETSKSIKLRSGFDDFIFTVEVQ